MSEISTKEFKKLYRQVRTTLGHPVVNVEIDEDTLLDLLDIAIEEYSSYLNDWLTHQQWGSLQNDSISKSDLLTNLTQKTLDFEKSFTLAYSKQAGLGSNGEWELKQDYVIISANTQHYTIPANREINEVLWQTPPQIGSYGLSNTNLSPVGWSAGAWGWSVAGMGMSAVFPSSYLTISTQDVKLRKQIIQSELTYRITAGPNGTKILHLYPVPASEDEIRGRYGKHVEGRKVYYWYYETDGNRDKCLEENNDIIKLPSDVDIKHLTWNKLNDSSKSKVRRLLIAECNKFLAMTRGRFQGEIIDAKGDTHTMEYNLYMQEYKDIRDKVYEELNIFLDKITYRSLLEEKAENAENLNRVLKLIPTRDGQYFIG